MRRIRRIACSIVCLLTMSSAVAGGEFSLSLEPDLLRASAVSSHETAVPGDTVHVALVLDIDEKGAFYGTDPGKYAKPAVLTVDAGGLDAGDPVWPAPQRYEQDLAGETVVQWVYKNEAVVYVPITIPADAGKKNYTIALNMDGQVCLPDKCIDVDAAAEVAIAVGDETVPNLAWNDRFAAGIEEARAAAATDRRPAAGGTPPGGVTDLTVFSGLGLALLAGLILNIMPCVLPVIPIRIISLVTMAGQDRRRMVTLGLAFAAGIVLFFVAVAAANIVFRLAFEQIFTISGLFQYRAARVILALIIVAVAANLLGAFEILVPGRIAGMGQGGGGGHLSSVGMGLMMAVLATPCSFAILANAVAWAQYVPLWLGTVAIVLIGVGMAVPHALLAAFPSLVEKLPQPGNWMENFRKLMGFILLPVAVWLIHAGSADAYPAWVTAYAVVLVMCLWIWGSWVRYDASFIRKLLVRSIAGGIAVAAGIVMLSPPGEDLVDFRDYDTAAIRRARENGRTVLVKFTSATCTSCIIIDRTVYSDPAVASKLAEENILPVVADVTDADSAAARVLKERYTAAPPLTVLLPPDGEPVRLDGKFSSADLIEKIDGLDAGG